MLCMLFYSLDRYKYIDKILHIMYISNITYVYIYVCTLHIYNTCVCIYVTYMYPIYITYIECVCVYCSQKIQFPSVW